jgi:hypothetical protein
MVARGAEAEFLWSEVRFVTRLEMGATNIAGWIPE